MLIIVALAWIYVAGMAAVAEALSPQGTVLGALFTFLLYGALPLGVVLYVLATPARKKALRRAAGSDEAAAGDAGPPPVVEPSPASGPAVEPSPASALDPDRRGHATAGAAVAPVAAKREEA